MKDRSQTIINVCLAIFVATTIYNTNQLNDKIDELTKVEQTNKLDLTSEIVTMQSDVDDNSIDISNLIEVEIASDTLIKNLDERIRNQNDRINNIVEFITK